MSASVKRHTLPTMFPPRYIEYLAEGHPYAQSAGFAACLEVLGPYFSARVLRMQYERAAVIFRQNDAFQKAGSR